MGKNSHRPNDTRQTRLKISLYFYFLSVIKAGFCFYIAVSVQTWYIMVLFSQYLCKTKDDSYCCAANQGKDGREDAVLGQPWGAAGAGLALCCAG